MAVQSLCSIALSSSLPLTMSSRVSLIPLPLQKSVNAFCFRFAANADPREGVDYADSDKKDILNSIPATWFN